METEDENIGNYRCIMTCGFITAISTGTGGSRRFWLMALCLLSLCRADLSAAEPYGPRPELITPATEQAVDKALAFLVGRQTAGGSWIEQSARSGYACVMTSLAGLALMAEGSTPGTGKYAENVRKAVDFLLQCSTPSGLITSSTEAYHSMYGHGFAMLFLAEAYGMETNVLRQERVAKVLSRAVELTVKSQSADGGWYYSPNVGMDEGSVTVTQIQALRACRNAGVHVPKQTIDRAVAYIEKCANPDGGISYSLGARGSSLPAITAAAIAVMYSSGSYENPVTNGAVSYILNKLRASQVDVWKAFPGHTFYSTLYTSQAMWLSSEENWKLFFPPTRDRLLGKQESSGAWHGDGIGEIYGTSIALLVLQLPYRNLPIVQR